MVATPSDDVLADAGAAGRRRIYDRIAPCYDLVDLPFEYSRYRKLRPLLFEGLRGRILDAGVGTGRNMPFYPSGSDVLGIDLSPAMLRRAERRRSRSRATVQLRQMDVTNLDFPDATFDAVVATFLFCTLPDELQAPALCELSRVLKPGGTLRLLDYRRSQSKLRRFIMRLWQPWAKWAFDASFDRHPERHLEQAGLEIVGTRLVAADLIAFVEARRQLDSKAHDSARAREGWLDPVAL